MSDNKSDADTIATSNRLYQCLSNKVLILFDPILVLIGTTHRPLGICSSHKTWSLLQPTSQTRWVICQLQPSLSTQLNTDTVLCFLPGQANFL